MMNINQLKEQSGKLEIEPNKGLPSFYKGRSEHICGDVADEWKRKQYMNSKFHAGGERGI